MGLSILDFVLRRLRSAGFQASAAYPGQKYPRITEPVAAVHIEKVDRMAKTVTLEISVICPESFGGTACEVEALRVADVLHEDTATCIQNGCSYDGSARVYVVSVLATYVCVTEKDSYVLGPGFRVYINDKRLKHVVRLAEECVRQHTAEYEVGQIDPTDISLGPQLWNVTIEVQYPPASSENTEPSGLFELKVEREDKTVTFHGCKWTSIHREMSRDGLRKVYKGIALGREEI